MLSKVRVGIFSELDSLAHSLVEKLLEKSCDVVIISSDVDKWRSGSLFTGNPGIAFIKATRDVTEKRFDYIVCLNQSSYIGRKSNYFSEKKIESAKTMFVFPYTLEKSLQVKTAFLMEKITKNRNLFAGILFVGDVIPKEEFFEKGNWLYDIFDGASRTRKFKIFENGQDLYPLISDTAAGQIIRSLFSLKAYGKTSAVIARPLDLRELHRIISKQDSKIKIVDKKKEAKPVLVTADEKIVIGEYVNTHIKSLAELYFLKKKKVVKDRIFAISKLSLKRSEKKTGQYKLKKVRSKVEISGDKLFRKNDRQIFVKIRASQKAWLGFLVVILVLLFMPQLMLAGGYASAVVAKKALDRGSVSITKSALDYSTSMALSANNFSTLFSKTPLLGSYYKRLGKTSYIFHKSLNVSKRTLLLYENLFIFWTRIFDDEKYSPSEYADGVYLELDFLYKELGFLQGELDNLPDAYKLTVNEIFENNDIANLRQKIYSTSEIVKQIPELLGEEEPKSYLVVLQNNLISRPTGGTIEAFALLTFSQGRLLDSKVYDISFADSKLKGYVEPPEGLDNVTSWYMRDASWDPEFPTSSEKTEWFLDKSIDVSVDGVISVDVEFIKEMLKENGPIVLANADVNHDNLYELVEESSDRAGYPMSDNSFFVDLLTHFLSKYLSQSYEGDNGTTRLISSLFDMKNAQLFLHNTKAQRAISDLGWDGAIKQGNCGNNCFSDIISIVIADVSKDKSLHSAKYSAKLFVSLEEGLVKKRLEVLFENEDEQGRSSKETTQLYIRVLADKDAGFGLVEVGGSEGKTTTTADVFGIRGHKEAGINLDLAPGDSKLLTFSWESGANYDFKKRGEYKLNWVKQAGVSEMPIEIEYNVDIARNFSLEPTTFLTKHGTVVYNSSLSRDFISRIFW